jgi:hypothetical protein
MSEQNRDAANQQAKEAQRIDPVRDANESRMPWSVANI